MYCETQPRFQGKVWLDLFSATDLGMAVPGSQQQRIELHHQRKRERGGEREREVSRKSFCMYV